MDPALRRGANVREQNGYDEWDSYALAVGRDGQARVRMLIKLSGIRICELAIQNRPPKLL